jgi:hypothetical protein
LKAENIRIKSREVKSGSQKEECRMLVEKGFLQEIKARTEEPISEGLG